MQFSGPPMLRRQSFNAIHLAFPHVAAINCEPSPPVSVSPPLCLSSIGTSPLTPASEVLSVSAYTTVNTTVNHHQA